MTTASRTLAALVRLTRRYGEDLAARKMELLGALEHARLSRAADVYRLHESLLFLRAYPDDAAVLAVVKRLLEAFPRRSDLRRHRRTLADSGIAGTDLHYRFFWPTARWLAGRWPGRLHVDWPDFENRRHLPYLLSLLLPYSESLALDSFDLTARQWIQKLKGLRDTDATFLIRRVEALATDSFGKEKLYDRLDVPLRLKWGPGAPARTGAAYPAGPVFFQKEEPQRQHLDLRRELRRRPLAVRLLPPGEGRRLIDLSREAMCTRSRDLDAFAWGNEDDVRRVDWGRGLQFAVIGLVPERRLLLETVYGFLTLKNGVPTGYVLCASLFRSSEVAFNVFDTYRGTETSFVLSRAMATMRRLFGSENFFVPPYQLGYGNKEGLQSGAWWFYHKLGFRPEDPDVRRVLAAELRKRRKSPAHRSSPGTLEELAAENMYFLLRPARKVMLGRLSLGRIGLAVSRTLSERYAADRERGLRALSREAARLLGVRSLRAFSPAERLAWERWAPLVMSLPGVERWPPADRRALGRVVRAKGARLESDFVTLFDRHRRLGRAVSNLAKGEME